MKSDCEHQRGQSDFQNDEDIASFNFDFILYWYKCYFFLMKDWFFTEGARVDCGSSQSTNGQYCLTGDCDAFVRNNAIGILIIKQFI